MLNGQREHGVGATRAVVHIVRGDNLVSDTKLVQSHHVINSLAFESVEVFNSEYVVLVPLEL